MTLTTHTTINITGMHCASCETLLTDVLGDVKGVKKAIVSKSTNTAEIEFDTDITDEKALRKAIEDEGYATQ